MEFMGRGSGSRSDYNDVTSIAVDAGVMDGIFFKWGDPFVRLHKCGCVVWGKRVGQVTTKEAMNSPMEEKFE